MKLNAESKTVDGANLGYSPLLGRVPVRDHATTTKGKAVDSEEWVQVKKRTTRAGRSPEGGTSNLHVQINNPFEVLRDEDEQIPHEKINSEQVQTRGEGSSHNMVSKRIKEVKMAGSPLGPTGERAEQYQGKVTPYVIITCIVAAIGGSLFGYDVGISGGVTSMDEFLRKFFYTVYLNKNRAKENNYCKYNNQGLAAFTSSLYLSGLVASIVASAVTKKHGRRWSIICGGISFLIGAVLNASAVNLSMLLLGRIMLGVGIGFGNQGISDVSFEFLIGFLNRMVFIDHALNPSPYRGSSIIPIRNGTNKSQGGLNMLFQLATTLGIFTANMINSGTDKIHPWGWRLSLGLAAAPAFLMTIGGTFLPETPNSLIERGSIQKGRKVLEKIRGTKNATRILTGINAILFYAPVLFGSMGFKGNASLYSSALTGAVLALSTLVSMGVVDRWGRRVLLISGGIQMILCQITAATILGLKFGNDKELSKGFSITVVTTICLFVAAFGWSWGPLGWTVPSEIFPLQTRSAAQSITVAVNLLFTFIIAQSFLSLLCALKFGFFLFFSGWIVIMTIFVYVFLPETKGVPLEEMVHLWEKHWFWKKFVAD
ncbi:hypothetical protein DH2020_014284 [Rehmannia glutinosa]|uniref:Major facilitator superfamily (MFS) profile domain-containing protein n=1 Tax=Rehmannia glutinosa TaxID=99300 RepID=A0ABR0WZC3_REHGL